MSLPTPYYDDGQGIMIYHGNCLDILPQLAPVELILTDPPYEAEAHTLQRRIQHEKIDGGYGRSIRVEEIPFAAMDATTRLLVASYISQLATRWILTFCQIEAAPLWRKDYELGGMKYKRTCIWVKPDGMPQYSGDRPGMGYEAFIAMHKEGRSAWNGGGRHGVWIVNKNENGGQKNEHPTTKPSQLINDLVGLFSNPGDVILDPFAGSGTTLRAAKDLGRRAIGIEIEEKYCEIAARRLAQEVLKL